MLQLGSLAVKVNAPSSPPCLTRFPLHLGQQQQSLRTRHNMYPHGKTWKEYGNPIHFVYLIHIAFLSRSSLVAFLNHHWISTTDAWLFKEARTITKIVARASVYVSHYHLIISALANKSIWCTIMVLLDKKASDLSYQKNIQYYGGWDHKCTKHEGKPNALFIIINAQANKGLDVHCINSTTRQRIPLIACANSAKPRLGYILIHGNFEFVLK